MLRKAGFIAFMFSFLFIGNTFAQDVAWNKKVSVSVSNASLTSVLFDLSEEADFDFSFDARLVPGNMLVSLQVSDMPLGEVVDELAARTSVKYTIKSNHIIFYKEKTAPAKTYQVLKGSVRDRNSGNPVSQVSVVEPFLLIAAITDDSGHFELEVPNPKYTIYLEFRKPGYQVRKVNLKMDEDNTIFLQMQPSEISDTASTEKDQSVMLQPEDISVPVVKSVLSAEPDSNKMAALQRSIFEEKWVQSFTSEKYRNSVQLDSGLRYMPVQFGLTPGLSSNLGKAAMTVNRGVSINALVGLSAGTQGAEAGGLVNINRFNMRGAQAAGLANIVGGHMNGVQAAGLVNKTKKRARGVQMAGLTNITGLSFDGAQAAGIANTVRGRVMGIQMAGIKNLATSDVNGMQVAGISNNGEGFINGMQVAGISNTSKLKIRGMQVAGVANLAESVKGVQVSGVFNYTHKLDGFQLSVVNVVDSLDHGTSIGFFSLVKNGYRRHEITSNRTGLINYHFKSGSNHFYNIFALGAQAFSDPFLWDFGYGVGTLVRPKKTVFGSVEVMCYSLQQPGWMNQLNLLNKLNTTLGFRIKNRWAITAGPAFNVYLAHKSLKHFADLHVEDNTPLNTTSQDLIIQGWVDFNVGIQF